MWTPVLFTTYELIHRQDFLESVYWYMVDLNSSSLNKFTRICSYISICTSRFVYCQVDYMSTW
jgi:hypothetical protein